MVGGGEQVDPRECEWEGQEVCVQEALRTSTDGSRNCSTAPGLYHQTRAFRVAGRTCCELCRAGTDGMG